MSEKGTTGRECYQFCDVEVRGERYCGQMCVRTGWHRIHICTDHLGPKGR